MIRLPLLSAITAGMLALSVGPWAQPAPSTVPTLVVTNGKVLLPNGSSAEAVAVAGERILRVGTNAEVLALKGAGTAAVDARGHSVIPGFIDSHVHFMIGGESLDQVNLRGTRTREEARERLREFVAAHPGTGWVRGANGYGRLTGADLDDIIPNRPAYIVAGDVHSLLANSQARRAAGITRQTPDPANGRIVRDERGEATGLMLESAQGLITKAVPAATHADRVKTLKAAIAEAQRSGVTSIVNIGGFDDIALFDEARRNQQLGVRIYSSIWVAPGGGDSVFPASVNATDADLESFESIRQRYRNDALLKVGAIKIMLDGVIESRTAAMLEPYLDVASSGTPTLTPERLKQIVTRMDARGWQIFTHALGDGAIRLALDAYEQAARVNPAPARGRRHRIEHLEATSAADLPRFASLGVIASLQPAHSRSTLNPNPTGGRITSIGPERHASGWPFKSIADAGGPIVFGSDWPVASLNPTPTLYVPLVRGPQIGVPDQHLSVRAVIDAYTKSGAWGEFEENDKGTLEAGKLADIVILSKDIFAEPPSGPDSVAVETTIFNGKVVYTR